MSDNDAIHESEKRYYDSEGNKRTLSEMVSLEPEWTASRFRHMENLLAAEKDEVALKSECIAEMSLKIAALERENEELQKDVERFAIVRKRIPSALARAFTMDDTPMSDDALNAAIDAALRQQTEQQGNSDEMPKLS